MKVKSTTPLEIKTKGRLISRDIRALKASDRASRVRIIMFALPSYAYLAIYTREGKT